MDSSNALLFVDVKQSIEVRPSQSETNNAIENIYTENKFGSLKNNLLKIINTIGLESPSTIS